MIHGKGGRNCSSSSLLSKFQIARKVFIKREKCNRPKLHKSYTGESPDSTSRYVVFGYCVFNAWQYPLAFDCVVSILWHRNIQRSAMRFIICLPVDDYLDTFCPCHAAQLAFFNIFINAPKHLDILPCIHQFAFSLSFFIRSSNSLGPCTGNLWIRFSWDFLENFRCQSTEWVSAMLAQNLAAAVCSPTLVIT